MRTGDKKKFLNDSMLYQMVNLRRNGIAFSSLALLFGVHRSSVAYQCDKFQIEPLTEITTVERIITQALPKDTSQYKVVNGERINLGKSYKEYLNVSISS